ncbi:MAG: Asp-tRNA(Asn)/Glu-tRNA(Gln) amidotransferase subunit GatC [Patescibacteria group bacterium]
MDVAHVAKLANLPLTPEEKTQFTIQLEHIITYVDQLQSVDTSKVDPTSQSIETKNSTREDKIGDCLKLETDYFKVPAVFAND